MHDLALLIVNVINAGVENTWTRQHMFSAKVDSVEQAVSQYESDF